MSLLYAKHIPQHLSLLLHAFLLWSFLACNAELESVNLTGGGIRDAICQ